MSVRGLIIAIANYPHSSGEVAPSIPGQSPPARSSINGW